MTKFLRKLTRVGQRSLAVVIPADIVREMKLRERQILEIYSSGQKIIIKDWKK